MKKVKKGSFLFILIFTIIIVFSVVLITTQELVQSSRSSENIEFYYAELIDKNYIEPKFNTGEPQYTFTVELRFKGDKRNTIKEKVKYIVHVKEKAYEEYGIGSVLKGYFHRESYYLAGLSESEPYTDLKPH